MIATTQPATTQPAGAPRLTDDPQFDVQQLAGQVVAGVKADLHNELSATVETAMKAEIEATGVKGNLTGYQSEFGVGAALAVLTALVALVVSEFILAVGLLRVLKQSSEREMVLIENTHEREMKRLDAWHSEGRAT